MKFYIVDNIDGEELPYSFDRHEEAIDFIFDNDLTLTHEIILK